MLRLWVTLYYGYWLLFLGLASFTRVRGQGQTPLNDVPSHIWWKGNSVSFYKYRNDGNCRQLALNSTVPNYNDLNGYVGFNQNGAWFGGLDKITFKLDGTSCVRVSTHRGEWVQMLFQNGAQGCSVGSGQSVMGDLRYYDHPECRTNEHRNQVDFMAMGGATPLDGTFCFNDRGVGGAPYAVYYRAFCEVSQPTSTITNTIINNHTNTIVNNLTSTIVRNITTIVPTIVQPEDLIPLIQTLMVRNSSLFKTFSVPSPVPAPPTIPVVNSINAPNNTQSRSDASERSLLGTMVVLWGLLMLACFMRCSFKLRCSLYTFCFVYQRCLPSLLRPSFAPPKSYHTFQLSRCASKEKIPLFYRRFCLKL